VRRHTFTATSDIRIFSDRANLRVSVGSVAIVAVFAIGAVSGNTKTTTKGAQFLAYHLFANVAVVAVSMDLPKCVALNDAAICQAI
jgi:hypothetical protein